MIWDYGVIDPFIPGNLYTDKIEDFSGPCGRDAIYFQPFWDALGIRPEGEWVGGGVWRFPEWSERYSRNLRFNDRAMHDDAPSPDVSCWHRDSPWRGMRDYYLGVWATNGQTEILSDDMWEYKPEAKHLVIVRNDLVRHRVGRVGFHPPTRHFVRINIFDRNWTPAIDKLVYGG